MERRMISTQDEKKDESLHAPSQGERTQLGHAGYHACDLGLQGHVSV